MKQTFKIFISQPFHDRKEIDIVLEREVIKTILMDKGMPLDLIEVIDNYHKDLPKSAGRVAYLGDSIKLMDEADVIIFAKGTDKAKGCKVEWAVAKLYGIPYIHIEELTAPTFNMCATITEMNRYRIDRGRKVIGIL